VFENTPDLSTTQSASEPPQEEDTLTHARARALLLRQCDVRLPPASANALAEHLLDCDSCYRYAQDVAAERHASPR